MDPSKGTANLITMLSYADEIDYREGLSAYGRYKLMMVGIQAEYPEFTLEGVTAAFCALSPNNDYIGNLRSLVSCLKYFDRDPLDITVSTYNHCKWRALSYLKGDPFDTKERGLKILSFYHNILDPESPDWVTIDGHMKATWEFDKNMNMKEARVGRREYRTIQEVIDTIAKAMRVLPNQVQAIIWFVRKRIYQIKYEPTGDLFAPQDDDDKWRILIPLKEIRPFGLKSQVKL